MFYDVCKIHGYQKFFLRKPSGKRCTECAKQAVNKARRSMKMKAIEALGSCCKICGYNRCTEALEFHHLDPTQKDITISSEGYSKGWKVIEKELSKCVLLCSNCHREVHAGLLLATDEQGVRV